MNLFDRIRAWHSRFHGSRTEISAAELKRVLGPSLAEELDE
jgi:hypothetical protein